MRDGYGLDPRGPAGTIDLVDRSSNRIARVNYNVTHAFAMVASYDDAIQPREANSTAGLRRALDAIAEEHYQLTTTPAQRFHERRKEILGDPIWGWFAFVIATAVAVVGWLG